MGKDETAQAVVTTDQTNTSEVTQTPGADLPDQPIPVPDKAEAGPVPYTEVRSPDGNVKSSQPNNSKAVDAPSGRRRAPAV